MYRLASLHSCVQQYFCNNPFAGLMVTVCSPRVRWRWWARQEHVPSMVMVYSNTSTLSHNYMVSTLSYALPLTLMHPCCGSGFLGSQALFSAVAMLIILCICILQCIFYIMYFLYLISKGVFLYSHERRGCVSATTYVLGLCHVKLGAGAHSPSRLSHQHNRERLPDCTCHRHCVQVMPLTCPLCS